MVIIFMECFTLKKVKRWKKPIIRIMPKNNNNSGGKKLAHKYEPAKVILKWNKQRMNVKNIISGYTYITRFWNILFKCTLCGEDNLIFFMRSNMIAPIVLNT